MEHLKTYIDNLKEYCLQYNVFRIPEAMKGLHFTNKQLNDVFTLVPEQKVWPPTWWGEKDKYVDEQGNHLATIKMMRGRLVYAAPGGGKTTLLLMYTYAFLTMFEEGEQEELVAGILQSLNPSNMKIVDVSPENKKLPVFIRARDLENVDTLEFQDIISNTVAPFLMLDEEKCKEEIRAVCGDFQRMRLIIDGIDEFVEEEQCEIFLKKFITFLDTHTECEVYMSSRPGRNNISKGIYPYVIPEFQLLTLENNADFVKEFAERWYDAVFAYDVHRKASMKKAFTEAYENNPELQRVLSNPLELTSFLMISQYNTSLPSDTSQLYEKSIELWLSWSQDPRYEPEDIKYQLAFIAYAMIKFSKKGAVIREDGFTELIRQARVEQKRLYCKDLSLEEGDINDFADYLANKSCIIRRAKKGGYEFVHFQYQAYLAAYCIVKNLFSKEHKKSKRLEYLLPAMEECQEEWKEVIFQAAVIDRTLKVKIIEKLFKCVKVQQKENYYVRYSLELLIRMTVSRGFVFSDEEKLQMWKLFLSLQDGEAVNQQYIFSMLYENSRDLNDKFAELLLEKSKDTEGLTLGGIPLVPPGFPSLPPGIVMFMWKYIDYIHFLIGCCSVSETIIRKLLLILPTLDGADGTKLVEFYHGINSWNIEIIKTIAREEKDNNKLSEVCFQTLAFIYIAHNKKTVFSLIMALLTNGDWEELCVARKIIFILKAKNRSWSAVDDCEDSKGWETAKYYNDVDGERADWDNCADELRELIYSQIMSDTSEEITQNYISIFCDLVMGGYVQIENEQWFSEDLFDYTIRMMKDRQPYIENQECFDMYYHLLSQFPINNRILAWGTKYKNTLNATQIESIREIYDREKKIGFVWIESFKILAIFGILSIKDVFSRCLYYYGVGEPYQEVCALQQIRRQLVNWAYDNFLLIDSRNMLAYLLRTGRIQTVCWKGKKYTMEELLEEGLKVGDAGAVFNYVLHISVPKLESGWLPPTVFYREGLKYLKRMAKKVKLTLVEPWNDSFIDVWKNYFVECLKYESIYAEKKSYIIFNDDDRAYWDNYPAKTITRMEGQEQIFMERELIQLWLWELGMIKSTLDEDLKRIKIIRELRRSKSFINEIFLQYYRD